MNRHILTRFLYGQQRAGWFDSATMRVFVRKSHRLHPVTKQRIRCFDIANITIAEQGKGIFKKWYETVKLAAKEAGFDAVIIESVQNEQFAAGIRKWGLIEAKDFGAPTFYHMF